MNNAFQTKRLDIDGDKKPVLLQALKEAAGRLDPDMRRMYDLTINQAERVNDKMRLTSAQVEIVRFSLTQYEKAHGQEHASSRMLLQLELSRKAYAELLAKEAVPA